MMKKFLCIMLCFVLALPSAVAETADTLQKLLVRQLTAGYGLRGKLNITASGVADWLNYLLPFTATDLQIRALGEKQGSASETISDDDDWQLRLYAKNSAGEEVGTTWLYGNPEGLYFQSELLPGTVLSYPIENIHLLYQLFRGEFNDLFFAFDPMHLTAPGVSGNPSSYHALANMLGISAEDWEKTWYPVLKKYFQHLDLWLTGYGDPSFMTGDSGALKLSATYTIPSDELKAEAKYLIGQMLFDSELQSLLIPHVTLEERMIYLNSSLVYFYEACIDALPLEGDIILSREMNALGEVSSTMISLPIPQLPDNICAPIGDAAEYLFGLSYNDLLKDMNRLTITQNGSNSELSLSGDKCSLVISASVKAQDDESTSLQGTMRILPNEGRDEAGVAASFELSTSHKLWQDEKYIDHDTSTFSIAFTSLADESAVPGSVINFSPVGLQCTVDYRNDAYKSESPAQVNLSVAMQLPDAEISAEAVVRITTQIEMQQLTSIGAQNITLLSAEEKHLLVDVILDNAVKTMATLNSSETSAAPGVPAPSDPAAE